MSALHLNMLQKKSGPSLTSSIMLDYGRMNQQFMIVKKGSVESATEENAHDARDNPHLYSRTVFDSIEAAADLIVAKPPKWSEADGTIDFYYWYYGTYAMFQMGGNHWRTWNHHLNNAVTKHQIQTGNAAGSWDPVGGWGDVGGRICSAALSVLSLEASYRYARLIR